MPYIRLALSFLIIHASFPTLTRLFMSCLTRLEKIWKKFRAVTSTVAFISSCANPVLYFFAGKSYIRREGLAFMARLFEATGMDYTRKSRLNSQNSRDKDKDAEVVLQDKDRDSSTNSNSNIKLTTEK